MNAGLDSFPQPPFVAWQMSLTQLFPDSDEN